ncbi:MAG: hypothetical protein AMJ81_00340 [Phycisphaerae bacterium SM23_33]|nr:MAG: hypothetical protein AMJ81_00340 [Phycisphaerae bacterium SM23_33]
MQPAGAAGPANRTAPGGKTDFASMFLDVVDEVDRHQQQSALAIQDLVAGRSQDVLSVVSEVANADLSFKLLIGVRNKIIEAYKQTMNMQL